MWKEILRHLLSTQPAVHAILELLDEIKFHEPEFYRIYFNEAMPVVHRIGKEFQVETRHLSAIPVEFHLETSQLHQAFVTRLYEEFGVQIPVQISYFYWMYLHKEFAEAHWYLQNWFSAFDH